MTLYTYRLNTIPYTMERWQIPLKTTLAKSIGDLVGNMIGQLLEKTSVNKHLNY